MSNTVTVASCAFVLSLASASFAEPPGNQGPPTNPGQARPLPPLRVVDSLGQEIGTLLSQNKVARFENNRWFKLEVRSDGFRDNAGSSLPNSFPIFFTTGGPGNPDCSGTPYLDPPMGELNVPRSTRTADGNVFFSYGDPVMLRVMRSLQFINESGLSPCVAFSSPRSFSVGPLASGTGSQ